MNQPARRWSILLALPLLLFCCAAAGQDTSYPVKDAQIPGPASPAIRAHGWPIFSIGAPSAWSAWVTEPQASMWYFPQAYRLDEHGKYLLMAPSLDRSGTIGFRCAEDAAP